jgi:hypothetical protein
LWTVGAAVVVFAVIQLVPYGRDHSNPAEPDPAPWPSEESAAFFDSACADCHSNRTEWPWYSNVAPMSWLIQRDVDEGRDEWNTSDWAEASDDTEDAVETIEEGSMPPQQYEPLHPNARLSADEQVTLIAALEQMGAAGDNSGPG